MNRVTKAIVVVTTTLLLSTLVCSFTMYRMRGNAVWVEDDNAFMVRLEKGGEYTVGILTDMPVKYYDIEDVFDRRRLLDWEISDGILVIFTIKVSGRYTGPLAVFVPCNVRIMDYKITRVGG